MSNKILKARRSSNKSKIRINSWEKQSGEALIHTKQKYKKSEQENSAVQSLLAVIEPQKDDIEWKEKLQQTIQQTKKKYTKSNYTKSKEFQFSKIQNANQSNFNASQIQFLLRKQKQKNGRQLHENHENRFQDRRQRGHSRNQHSYHFRQPINDQNQKYYDQLLLISSNSLHKIGVEQEKQKQEKQNSKMNLCFLNRTNAWLRNISTQKKSMFNKTFVKSGAQLCPTNRKLYLHQSFKTFYKKHGMSELKIQGQRQKSIGKRCSSTGLVKLNQNKAQNVREMLNVFSQEKHLRLKIESKKENVQKQKQIRSPFDPYKRVTKQHHKKFMSFRASDEKELLDKLQKLQQKIIHNPQFQLKQDFCVKYLQSPMYCAWVKKNKQKVKPRQKQAPTIKPLKINQH